MWVPLYTSIKPCLPRWRAPISNVSACQTNSWGSTIAFVSCSNMFRTDHLSQLANPQCFVLYPYLPALKVSLLHSPTLLFYHLLKYIKECMLYAFCGLCLFDFLLHLRCCQWPIALRLVVPKSLVLAFMIRAELPLRVRESCICN